jgi:tetratricopeptide (TPR) repeat protein
MAIEIEKTAREIEQVNDTFFRIYNDLLEKGRELDSKFSDRMDDIGKDLKDFHSKSEGIEGAWRLNQRQFEEGRLEKDAYERRLRELTKEITEVKFDCRKIVIIELEVFERQFNAALQKRGVPSNLPHIPSNLPNVEQEFKLDISEEEREKVEAVAKSIDESREKLGEVGFEEKFGDREAYNRLGIFYLDSSVDQQNWSIDRSKLEKGMKYFERALEIDSEYADAWNNLGKAYSLLLNDEQAIKCSKRALEIDPEYVDAWLSIAWYNFGLEDYFQAIRNYERCLEIDPEHGYAWNMLGWACVKVGDYKQAIRSLDRSLEINPEWSSSWHYLGEAYKGSGDKENAKRCYEKAKELGYPYLSLFQEIKFWLGLFFKSSEKS